MSETRWSREGSVASVVCPDCAFTFDAKHEDERGGYSCPVCAENVMAVALSVIAAGHANPNLVAQGVIESLGLEPVASVGGGGEAK